ncbi:MAG: M23 family metallopeptidase [Phototrophicaceae bacterium]|jgi:hypothetical protein
MMHHAPTGIMAWRAMPLLLALLFVIPARAQGECPPATTFSYPVDPNSYSIVQDYGARSVRHNGRYHTAEDWALPEGNALGQPVVAIANGRVTYASPTIWGRDGGVVILEHRLPDDTSAFTLYGHIAPLPGQDFPSGCIAGGTPLGVIMDVRPAPHVHIEVRVSGILQALGNAYSWEYPDVLGYRRPSRFIQTWIARSTAGVRWVTALNDPVGSNAPPLALSDDSLLMLDGGRIIRLLPDGRVLWRTLLPRPAVAVLGDSGAAWIAFADGTFQQVSPDGAFGDSWSANLPLTGIPFALDGVLIFPTTTGAAAININQRAVAARYPELPAAERVTVGGQVIALQDANDTLHLHNRANFALLGTANLRPNSVLAAAPDGTLWHYGTGGLWQITNDGQWTLDPSAPQAVFDDIALAFTPTRDRLTFDGVTLGQTPHSGGLSTDIPLPYVDGQLKLLALDARILLLSSNGAVVVIGERGQTCRTQLYGAGNGQALWAAVGQDGLLRVQIGGMLAGLDLQRFESLCPSA